MTQSSTSLPSSVIGPLKRTAFGLLAFLVVITLWALKAPLATSVSVSGELASSRPSYDMQHAYGGPIAWVGVREQQSVQQGEILFRIDVSTQKDALREIQLQLEALSAENQVITTLRRHRTDWESRFAPSPLVHRYAASYGALQHRQTALTHEAESARNQALSGESEAALIAQRIALLKDLRAAQAQLRQQGLARQTDVEGLSDQILELSADLQQRQSSTASLSSQAEQAEIRARSELAEFEAQLLTTLRQNTLQMSRLRAEQSRLEAEIGAADIRSPVTGHVHALDYDSPQMIAPRGQTLAVIAQTLDRPIVRLSIPPDSIDQVQVGMQGKLILPSLPQRDMPQMEIEILTISPQAEKDQDGVPRGYTATARISAESLSEAQSMMAERFRLVTDMPVTATLSGRNITFAEYLIKPFVSALRLGLQD